MIPTSTLILVGVIVAVIALILFVFAKQYRKVGPNEVLIIAGGRKRTVVSPDGTKVKVGYRYRLGGGTFVLPFAETVYRLPMDVISLNIKTPEVLTNSGVPIMAEATAQVKVDSSDFAIRLAAEQFLGVGKDGIRDVALNVLEGHMREVMGTMTVEQIVRGRQEFSARVSEAVKPDLSRMGLVMLSFALKDISDAQGFLDSLSKPQIAAAKRDALIAEAETEKESIVKSSQARKEGEVARLAADALIAKAQWENEAKKAESQVMVNQRKAQADFSYELERYRLSQQIKKEEATMKAIEKTEAIKLEELEIARREKELESIRHQAGRRPQVPDQVRSRSGGVPHPGRSQRQGRGAPGRGRSRSRDHEKEGVRRGRGDAEESPGLGKIQPGRGPRDVPQDAPRPGQGRLRAAVQGRQYRRRRRRRKEPGHDEDHRPGRRGAGPDAGRRPIPDRDRHQEVPPGQVLG